MSRTVIIYNSVNFAVPAFWSCNNNPQRYQLSCYLKLQCHMLHACSSKRIQIKEFRRRVLDDAPILSTSWDPKWNLHYCSITLLKDTFCVQVALKQEAPPISSPEVQQQGYRQHLVQTAPRPAAGTRRWFHTLW